MIRIMTKWMATLLLLNLSMLSLAFAGANAFSNKIESIDFSPLSGGRVSIKIQTTEPLSSPPAGFTLKSPARIALDFPSVGNGLSQNKLSGQGVLKSVVMAQAKDRTRMVLNLAESVGYDTKLQGNDVIITLAGGSSQVGESQLGTQFSESNSGSESHAITNVDFTRGQNGEGRVIVDLADSSTGINIKRQGENIIVDFVDTNVAAELQRRLNVISFNTPVLYVDTVKRGNDSRMVIEPKGNWEQSAYQSDKKFIIDVRPVVEDPNQLVKGAKAGYGGEKLSLNFQDIEVRSVLQVIADFTGLNIVASDTVTGSLTLRLKDVPWDQALDIIMQNKGLTMRKVGNVITVAPSEEVAAKDQAELEALKAKEGLEPLVTEVFKLNYQKADELKGVLTGAGAAGKGENKSILSDRGTINIDQRTNTLFIQDTARKLAEIQSIINLTDVPVRQVMIESRLVLADEKFGKSLGARFGVSSQTTPGDNSLSIGAGLGANNAQAGTSGGLNSNLPVFDSRAGNLAFSLFRLPAGLLLNLELTALETDNRGKIVSSPRVTTGNQQTAKIAQGVEIPYEVASSSGASTVQFKKAELSLEVTPQITPDNKIIMDLDVRKDSRGEQTGNGPAINTQNVQTQVLVANGETAVLGGIYEQLQRNQTEKVPFFGDIPIIGNAFKRRQRADEKTELLIFVTPKIMDESLGLR